MMGNPSQAYARKETSQVGGSSLCQRTGMFVVHLLTVLMLRRILRLFPQLAACSGRSAV
jgi:hypothetical protein